jgi:hypothetical protein
VGFVVKEPYGDVTEIVAGRSAAGSCPGSGRVILPLGSPILDFARVFDVLTSFFEREGLQYATVGAFGLHAYGLTRATRDLDLVTEARGREQTVAFLESQGYETLHASAGYSNHLHADPALGRVDLVYVAGETSRQLFAGCAPKLSLAGRKLPVPRAEHLAAMKVQAMKNDPTRALQDLADIQALLGVPGVDAGEIRGYFVKAGLLGRYDELKRSS